MGKKDAKPIRTADRGVASSPQRKKEPPTATLHADDIWLAALGTRLLHGLEKEGAAILSEFEPGRLAQTLRRKLDNAQRAHLDYVVKRLLEWRAIDSDFEGELPWDPDEPWTGPSYDPAPTRRIIERAIRQGSDLEIDYFTHARSEFTTRRVTPHGLEGRYLLGYCHLRQDERTFRIERIANLRPAGKRRR